MGVKIEKPRKLIASAALVALLGTAAATATINFIGREEGEVRTPYGDLIGVMTVCYGHTGKDIEQRQYTPQECEQLLNDDIVKHAKPLFSCLKNFDQATDGVKLAFISLAINAGTGSVCNGSIARDYNAGDTRAACRDVLKYNRAGGKILKSLSQRRQREFLECAGEEDKTWAQF